MFSRRYFVVFYNFKVSLDKNIFDFRIPSELVGNIFDAHNVVVRAGGGAGVFNIRGLRVVGLVAV